MEILSFLLGYENGKDSIPSTDLFPLQRVSGFGEDPNFSGSAVKTLPEHFTLEEGKTYAIEWDGESYKCEAVPVKHNDLKYVYIGNGTELGYSGNDEPFAILYIDDYDMIQIIAFNDLAEEHNIRIYESVPEASTIEVKPLSVTENGTYTAPEGEAYSPVNVEVEVPPAVEIKPLTITENGTYTAPEGEAYSPIRVNVENETDIFPLQTVEGFVEDTTDFIGCALKTLSEPFEIKEGETYYVKWDGTTYTCEGISAAPEGLPYTYVYLGNGSRLGYPSNNEPFAIIYIVEANMVQILATNLETSHDIRIYQKEGGINVAVNPILITANGTYTAPEGEAYSPITVSVASGVVGEILPGYELEEIMPRTELTFRTGASDFVPFTPATVIATEADKANVPKLEDGDNGLVFWGNTLYAVACGTHKTPMIPIGGFDQPLGIPLTAGNVGIPYVWGLFSGSRFVRLNAAGESIEPFLISSGVGDYIIATDGEPDIENISGGFAPYNPIDPELPPQLKNYFVYREAGKFRIELDKTFNIVWERDTYTCQSRSGVLTDPTTNQNVDVIYIGNGTILGQADTGEPFTVIYGETFLYVVALDPYNQPDYTVNDMSEFCRFNLYIWSIKEFTQSVQIFKIKQKQYTVNFYDDDTVTLLNTVQVGHGNSYTYTPTKEGYIFKGWNPEPTNVTAPMDCYAIWEEKVTFAKSSWAKISEISQAGQASEYFALGDTRIETLNYSDGTSEEIELQIVAIGKDTTIDGTPTMTLVPKHLLTKTSGKVWTSNDELYSRTEYNSNACYTKAFLEETVMPAMSSELQNVLQTACPTQIDASSTPLLIQNRGKISLLNYAEIGLKSTGANASSTDDVLYGFDNTEESRIRTTVDGTTHQWWELAIFGFYFYPSVATSYKYKKCMVGTNGTFEVSRSDSSEIATHCLFKICI